VPPGAARWGERVERDPLLDRLKKQGGVAAKRQAATASRRIEAEAAFLLARSRDADITLVELQEKLKARGVSVGIGTLWRFFDRRRITFKKDGACR